MSSETQPLIQPCEVRVTRRRRRRYDSSRCGRFILIALFGTSLLAFIAAFLPRYIERKFLLFAELYTPLEISDAFTESINSENRAAEFLKRYTNESHLAGDDRDLAQYTADVFAEYGLDTSFTDYEVYLNSPLDHSLKMLLSTTGEVLFEPTLDEDVLEEDVTSSHEGSTPVFHGYSANGNVTGQFVYANFGTKKDFETLAELGVDLEGKIAIVRNGGGYRGLKVKFAEDHGIVGMLMYPDPSQDHGITETNGYSAYPKGPARNPSSVERGSLKSSNLAPGDPTTFGYPSKPGCRRHQPQGLPKIPTLPISYREVKPILESLNGCGLHVPGFKGAIPGVEYSTGPNEDLVLNLYNAQNYTLKTIRNVIGKLEGRYTNDVIVIGNHRDSWIKGGAGDPNSGSAVLLETVRGIAGVKKKYPHWKPLRTLVFISWDAEEYGLLGSSEFGEEFGDSLSKNVVAYFNTDVGVSGSHLGLSAAPLLSDLLLDAAKSVKYPRADQTLFEHSQSKIEPLGSGSDFTVFFEHLGIPCVDIGYDAAGDDAVYHYHSNYDSYHWMSTFVDQDWSLHQSLAEYLGKLVLSLSETPLLKFDVAEYAKKLKEYHEEINGMVPSHWVEKNNRYKNHKFAALMKTFSHKVEKIGKSSAKLANKLKLLQEDFVSATGFAKVRLVAKILRVNVKLKYLERQLLGPGLPNRPWFKHLVFASGRYDGYAGQTFPGLRESLEDNDFEAFAKELLIVIRALSRYNAELTI